MSLVISIPVKAFGVAKARLHPVLDARERSRLGKSIAARTVGLALDTGARVAVVTGGEGVARWARALGAEVVMESAAFGGGLNGAAAAAVESAERTSSAWLILHADLPLLSADDLAAAVDRFPASSHVIAPSYNGGTSLLMGRGTFPFSYGPLSFHRHLRAAGEAAVIVRTGLTIDLDTPRDLKATQVLKAARLRDAATP